MENVGEWRLDDLAASAARMASKGLRVAGEGFSMELWERGLQSGMSVAIRSTKPPTCWGSRLVP
jgi:hypothetical protein